MAQDISAIESHVRASEKRFSLRCRRRTTLPEVPQPTIVRYSTSIVFYKIKRIDCLFSLMVLTTGRIVS